MIIANMAGMPRTSEIKIAQHSFFLSLISLYVHINLKAAVRVHIKYYIHVFAKSQVLASYTLTASMLNAFGIY